MSIAGLLPLLVKASYFVAAALFLLGLQRMASPKTARSGIRWAGAGMVLATVATFALPGLENLGLIVLALWRLLFRDDLDVEDEAAGPRKPWLKSEPNRPEAPGDA